MVVDDMSDFSPREIVSELDRFIVGQADAKRAVAIALRNRWRRLQLDDRLREEVLPKNILMIGPTGVRQDRDFPPSRQARRRAVPQGRGDQVHRGRLCRPRRRADRARPRRDRHRVDARAQAQGRPGARRSRPPRTACSMRWSAPAPSAATEESFRRKLRAGELDDKEIEIEVAVAPAACRCSTFPACPARRWAPSRSATFSASSAAAAPRRGASTCAIPTKF